MSPFLQERIKEAAIRGESSLDEFGRVENPRVAICSLLHAAVSELRTRSSYAAIPSPIKGSVRELLRAKPGGPLKNEENRASRMQMQQDTSRVQDETRDETVFDEFSAVDNTRVAISSLLDAAGAELCSMAAWRSAGVHEGRRI